MSYSENLIPPLLLKRFNIQDARVVYSAYWQNVEMWVQTQPHLEADWRYLQLFSQTLMNTFPGLGDPKALNDWMVQHAQCREGLFVLPSIMGNNGIGDRNHKALVLVDGKVQST